MLPRENVYELLKFYVIKDAYTERLKYPIIFSLKCYIITYFSTFAL